MKLVEERLRTWLETHHYAEQTVRGTVVQGRRILAEVKAGKTAEELASPHLRTHLVRLLAAPADAMDKPFRDFLAELSTAVDAARPKRSGLKGGKSKTRKTRPKSVDDNAWPKLLAALKEHPGGAARVLQVETATGLRVGDILRIETSALLKSAESGRIVLAQKGGSERMLLVAGAPEAWTALTDFVRTAVALNGSKKTRNVAAAISTSDDTTSSGAAYARCKRLLHELGDKLGLDRLHTHRLRRTVAVQTLRVTGDLPAVREMLGQAPGSRAVEEYIDESRGDKVAELSREIHERFGGGT